MFFYFFDYSTCYSVICWCWQVCRMGKYHNVLYIAMKVSWNWGVKDSTVVCALLSMNWMFICWKLWTTKFELFFSMLYLCCRWNIWLWENIWTAISRCYFWNKCSILYSWLEEWFQGSGLWRVLSIEYKFQLLLFCRMKMLEQPFISCIMLVNNVSNTVLRNIIFRKTLNNNKHHHIYKNIKL